MIFDFIKGRHIKEGYELFYKSAKAIIKDNAIVNQIRKRKTPSKDIRTALKATPSLLHTKFGSLQSKTNLQGTGYIWQISKSNFTIQTGFMAPPMGITLINDLLQQCIISNEIR